MSKDETISIMANVTVKVEQITIEGPIVLRYLLSR